MPPDYKRKLNQTLKYSGKPHINKNGIPILGRSMRPPCNDRCRQKCYKKITESERQRLFDDYYGLADLHCQWQYLGRYMDKTVPKMTSISKQRMRGNNIRYFLQTDTERLKVCKTMFLATFDISERAAITVVQKTNDEGVLVKRDGRGSHRLKHEIEHPEQIEYLYSSSEIVKQEAYT